MELLYLRSSFYAVDESDDRKRHKNLSIDGTTEVVSVSELQEQLLCNVWFPAFVKLHHWNRMVCFLKIARSWVLCAPREPWISAGLKRVIMLQRDIKNWAPDVTAATKGLFSCWNFSWWYTSRSFFEFKPLHLKASAVFSSAACSLAPLKVPSTSCTAVRPRLFELTSSDRLSPYIKHHNRAIL